MKRSILLSLMVIGAVAALIAGAGSFASFSDTETSNENTFTSGTLNLSVNATDPLTNGQCTVATPIPGSGGTFFCTLNVENTGTLDGTLSLNITSDSCAAGAEPEPETSLPAACNIDTDHTTYAWYYDDTGAADCSTVAAASYTAIALATNTNVSGVGGLTDGETDRLCLRTTISALTNEDQGDILSTDFTLTLDE